MENKHNHVDENKFGLRACPFCGLAHTVVYSQENAVECYECDIYGPSYLDKSKAVAAWNSRPLEDALTAEVARLTGLLHAANVRKDALEGRVAELERNAKWIEAHPQGVDSLNFTVFVEDMFGNWRCCACLEEWCLFDEVTPQESNIKYCPSCGSVIQAYQDYGKED